MSSNMRRPRRRPLRGEALDQALTRELEGMIVEGVDVSPISLAAVARRLALGGRTTLYEPARFERIRAAGMRQKQSSRGVRSAAQSSRDNAHSHSDLQQVRQQLNELRGYIVQIAINAHRMGLRPEVLLAVAERQLNAGGTLNADRLVVQYLSGIGLLAKVDENVRRLAR